MNLTKREKNIFKLALIFTGVFVAVAVVATVVLVVVFENNPETEQSLLNYINELFAAVDIIDEQGKINFSLLFANNLSASLYIIGYGLIPFLFLPIFAVLLNAAIVGIVGALSLSSGLSVVAFVMGILPHGIFEIPAICLAAALGCTLCKDIMNVVLNTKERPPFKSLVYEKLKLLALIVIPLLLVAAVIEAYVTANIMMLFI